MVICHHSPNINPDDIRRKGSNDECRKTKGMQLLLRKSMSLRWIFVASVVKGMVVALYSRPVNEWCAIALAPALTRQYLFRHAIIARAKLYMLQQVHSVIILEIIHLQLYVQLSFHS